MDDNARTGELRRKLEKDPGSRLFGQFAEELRKEGKHDEAIAVCRKGLEKNPNFPSARLTLARALLDSGRPREARPELEQIVKASPDNIMASRLLGEALEELGELELALKQFEKTLIFSPGDKAVTEKLAVLKARMAAPPAPTVPPTLPPAVPEASAPAQALPAPAAAALPSVFGDPPAAAPALPSAFGDEASSPETMPPPAATIPPTPVPGTAPASVALDRDLASGTFSPGSLNAADLQKQFEETAQAGSAAAPQAPPLPAPVLADNPDHTLAFGQMQASEPAAALEAEPVAAESLPAVEMPAGETDPGAQTLPLSSVTLADLYLQQGLKAEASAVLAQVMKDEPENAEARSKLAAVSGELAASTVPAPPPVAVAPAPSPVSYRSARGLRRDRTIAALKLFASAAEREAMSQRATERGAI